MPPLHRAARAFAEAGIPVFPCVENGKQPATANGFKDASADLARIDAWWGDNPNYNVALCPNDAGWCVVDLDPPVGLNNWAELQKTNPVPATYRVQTPRGGEHWYFEGALPPSANKLAEKIDTRGVGSYVLVPPSVVNDKPYRVIDDRDMAPCPEWIAAALKTTAVVAKSADERRDLPQAVDRGRSLLRSCVARKDVAVEGAGGDDRTYRLACELLNLGLSSDKARELLTDIWNPHCKPPWSEDELVIKFTNAEAYAQNEAGAWAVAPASEIFGAALDKLPKTDTQERRSRFHLEDEDEQENTPEPVWLLKDLIQEGTTALLVGTSGSYKSFLALSAALGISAGIETFGDKPKQGPTIYAALEGKRAIKKARRKAWKIANGVDAPVKDFYVMTAPMIALDEEIQEFGDEIAKRCGKTPPRLIILDTVTKCMAGLNENDAADVGRFIRFCDSLTETFGCAVLAIHHKSDKANASDMRGSSAFRAGFNTTLEVEANRTTKAVALRVKQHKDAEERETPWTFQGKVIGPSLYFFPTTQDEHAALTAEQDTFDARKVGAVLQRLEAFGEAKGVTTFVLAQSLIPPSETETPDQRSTSVGLISKKLGALSRGKLKAYNVVKGAGIIWCLPGKAS